MSDDYKIGDYWIDGYKYKNEEKLKGITSAKPSLERDKAILSLGHWSDDLMYCMDVMGTRWTAKANGGSSPMYIPSIKLSDGSYYFAIYWPNSQPYINRADNIEEFERMVIQEIKDELGANITITIT